MLSDLESHVRSGLSSLVDETSIDVPPVAALYARAERAATKRPGRRRLRWLAIPTVALAAATGGAVAIADGRAPRIVTHGFDAAKQWNPAWNIPPSNTNLVASAVGADGSRIQYWLGVSATSPAQCEQLIIQPVGEQWQSLGQSCVQGNALPDPTQLQAGGGSTQHHGVYVYFHTPVGATEVIIQLADGTTRTVPVTTPGFALALLPSSKAAVSAAARDAAGNTLGSIDLHWLGELVSRTLATP
jgi:hypothetical protein